MGKNMYYCLIAVSVLSVLAIWRSVSATASIALIVAGSACYLWDSRSKSVVIRKTAFSRNAHLIGAGTLLFLLTLITIGSGTEQGSIGFTGFLWVVAYTFSMTAAPVMLWHHFSKRRYQIDKGRLAKRQRVLLTPSCPVFFESRENAYQAKSFSYRPSKHQQEIDQKQLRMVV